MNMTQILGMWSTLFIGQSGKSLGAGWTVDQSCITQLLISLSPSKINRDSSTSLHSLLCCLSKQDSRHRKGDLKSLMLRNEYSGSCILIPYFIIIIAKTTQKLKSNESVYKCRLHCIWLNGPAATSRSFNNATATINKTKYFHNISDKVS